MHSTPNAVHTHTFIRSRRLQLPADILVMVDESTQRVAILVVEEALQDPDGSNMVRQISELLPPCCPVGSLLGGRPWVSARKWGFALSFPFSSASNFAAFKAPF